MQDHTTDVIEFIPTLISEFPNLAKKLYYFCNHVDDKAGIADAILKYLGSKAVGVNTHVRGDSVPGKNRQSG